MTIQGRRFLTPNIVAEKGMKYKEERDWDCHRCEWFDDDSENATGEFSFNMLIVLQYQFVTSLYFHVFSTSFGFFGYWEIFRNVLKLT